MTAKRVVSLTSRNIDCRRCGLASRCLPQGLDDETLATFAAAVKRRRVAHRGEHLFFQDEPSETLYLLRSGSVKVYTVDADGEEQVLGFYLPGDVFGLDALRAGRHLGGAVALETVNVCELPFQQLAQLGDLAAVLQRRMFSSEIGRDYGLLQLLGKKSAEQRLGGFLLQLSERYAERGYSAREFLLTMSRQDIGDHLGLALETVSRVLTRLQRRGVIAIDRRRVRIRDTAALAVLAGEGVPAAGRRVGYGAAVDPHQRQTGAALAG